MADMLLPTPSGSGYGSHPPSGSPYESSVPCSSTSPEPSGISESSLAEYDPVGRSRSSSSSPLRTMTLAPRDTGRKRIRPKIDLAPGQPPTARGNPRIRVFVACYQCRARKIRCDGAKPICINCQKRPAEVAQCSYDSGPNRRGRVKASARSHASTEASMKPATQRKGNRRNDDELSDETESADLDTYDDLPQPSGSRESSPPSSQEDVEFEGDLFDLSNPLTWDYDPFSYDPSSSIRLDQIPQPLPSIEPSHAPEQEQEDDCIPPSPGAQFSRETWWDALLTYYTREAEGGASSCSQILSLSAAQRTTAVGLIKKDLRALLRCAPRWFCFLHLPRFFESIFDAGKRNSLQPSLLLAALAIGTLQQSSEVDLGTRGRRRALKLLDMAHSALQGALATGWVDEGLAQGAMFIVCFEMHAHPLSSVDRSRSSLLLLDSLVRLMSLNSIDEGLKPRGRSPYACLKDTASHPYNPVAQLGIFPQRPLSSHSQAFHSSGYHNHLSQCAGCSLSGTPCTHQPPPFAQPLQPGCHCDHFILAAHYPSIVQIAPEWQGTLMWPEGISEGEFRREQCRRLIWTIVLVTAKISNFWTAKPDANVPFGQLFVQEPENLAVLLPGESLASYGKPIAADDIWSLCLRLMLLLHSIVRVRENTMISLADRAQLGVKAWLEVDTLERKLDRHTCRADTDFGFKAKDLVFHLRMISAHEFRSFVPPVTTTGSTLFYRDKAEAWLRYSEEVSDVIWECLQTGAPPRVRVFWFLTNIQRCLTLWGYDKSFIDVLKLSRVNAERAEHLMMFWPSMCLRQHWQSLRMQLVEACLNSGLPPPSPAVPRIPRNQGQGP